MQNFAFMTPSQNADYFARDEEEKGRIAGSLEMVSSSLVVDVLQRGGYARRGLLRPGEKYDRLQRGSWGRLVGHSRPIPWESARGTNLVRLCLEVVVESHLWALIADLAHYRPPQGQSRVGPYGGV